MGEQEFRIFMVGAPQLDDIVSNSYRDKMVTIEGHSERLPKRYILVLQHPILAEVDEAGFQMDATISACIKTGLPIYWIYPNSDLGYVDILKVLDRYKQNRQIIALANVERQTYLSLLANCSVLVGNSSSGILEAPSFKIPVVNIGNRQRGRPQASNIINCDYTEKEIARGIEKALIDKNFQADCMAAINPYGDGQSSERICHVLQDIEIHKTLMAKECTY